MTQQNEQGVPATQSRRGMMAGFGAASGVWLFGPTAHAQLPDQPTPATVKGIYPVTAFGAVGDGKTDDTAAIQKALNAAGLTGGVALLPAGNFLVKGNLIVHANVTLEGVFRAPTARSQGYGTTLLATGNKGHANGAPLFFLKSNAAIKGLTVFYPEQDAKKPVEYPWCVRGQGDNIAVLDVLLVNPWDGVDFATHPCGRHFVSGLHGQPLHTGLSVDQCLDCGRVENVHFWPFWTTEPVKATREMGTAFRFARSDWQMLSNVFCLGYYTGFHFTAVRHDAGNALVTNSGSDLCDVALRVEYSQVHAGLLFSNCQINAGVRIERGSLGPVKFSNCGLFGTGTPDHPHLADADGKATHVLNRGQGRATFIGCHFYHPEGPFVPKGTVDAGHPVIDSDGNGLTLSGCDMTGFDRNHVRLGKGSKSVIVTGSRFLGGLKLENAGKGKVVTGHNIDE